MPPNVTHLDHEAAGNADREPFAHESSLTAVCAGLRDGDLNHLPRVAILAPGAWRSSAMRNLIIYESASVYLEARTLARELAGVPCYQELPETGWKFDLLRIPTLREVAASDAAQAETIIVAYEHAWIVPAELEEWLRDWEQFLSQGAQTLVALHARHGLTPSSPKGRQFTDRLCGFAQARGLRFVDVENEAGIEEPPAEECEAPGPEREAVFA